MKIGLYLSGGGIKGVAHIGVLQALEEEGINIEMITGVSSGSIVASLYAAGYKPLEIYEIFKRYAKTVKYMEFRNVLLFIKDIIFKKKLSIKGLNSGRSFEKLLEEYFAKKGVENITDLERKLLIPSIELYDGKIHIFSSLKNRKGYSSEVIYNNNIKISKAVRASCSYPGLFEPCIINSKEFIDGGIRGDVICSEMKANNLDCILGVIFNREIETGANRNLLDVIVNSISMLSYELSKYKIEEIDEIINIETKNISLLDNSKIEYLYNLGYILTKRKLREIKNKIK